MIFERSKEPGFGFYFEGQCSRCGKADTSGAVIGGCNEEEVDARICAECLTKAMALLINRARGT